MAATPQATALTETHRLVQVRIGALTVQQMTDVWPILDLEHLDATFPRWLSAVQRLVGAQHQLSSAAAAAYYTQFRRMELGSAKSFAPKLAAPVDGEALLTSMLVTGPVSVKSAIARGIDLEQAANIALARAAGAGMRHALSGGRNTIAESVAADPRALGWARASSGNACAFCAMLAGRGPVYSEDTVDFEAHDHCSCSSEPVYSTDAPWPQGSDRYRQVYNDATADVPAGGDLLNAFRRAYESQPA